MNKLAISMMLGGILFATAADNAVDYPKLLEKLQAENAHLKDEIQNLRKLLGSSSAQPSPNVNASTSAPTADNSAIHASGDVKTAGFWLTSSSKKRHNSSCRYYKTSNGSVCGAKDGIPCKVCGG